MSSSAAYYKIEFNGIYYRHNFISINKIFPHISISASVIYSNAKPIKIFKISYAIDRQQNVSSDLHLNYLRLKCH